MENTKDRIIYTEEELKNGNDILNKINDEYLKSTRPVIRHIYYELPMLQDIYLGALLLMKALRNADDYNYMFSQLPYYNKRLVNSVSDYFPKLNISDEDIFTFIINPDNHKKLFMISPMTDLFTELDKQHEEFVSINRDAKCVGIENVEIVYTINTYPINISNNKELQILLKSRLKYISEDIKVAVICTPTKTTPKDIYNSSDILGVFNIKEFFDPSCSVYKDFAEDKKFLQKVLLIPGFIINDEVLENIDSYTEDQIRRSRKISEQFLGLATLQSVIKNPKILIG